MFFLLKRVGLKCKQHKLIASENSSIVKTIVLVTEKFADKPKDVETEIKHRK